MKTPIQLSLFLFLFHLQTAYAQYITEKTPLPDAINYVNAAQNGNYQVMWDILDKYVKNVDTSEIMNEISDNEYITLYDKMFSFKKIDRTAILEYNKEAYVMSSSASNLLGTPMIDVLGSFLATRFREELTSSFLDSFRKKLQNEPYLSTIFKNAKLVLLNEDVFDHKAWLPSFRAAFYDDLKALPKNIPTLINAILNKVHVSTLQKKKIDLILNLYSSSIDLIEDPSNNYQIINNFLSNAQGKMDSDKLNNSFALLQLLMNEFSVNSNWIDAELFTELKKPEVFSTFIGFVIYKHQNSLKKIQMTIGDDKIRAYKFLVENKEIALNDLANFTSTLESHINKSNELIEELKKIKTENSGLTYANFQPLVTHSLNGFKILMNTKIIQASINESTKEKVAEITNYSIAIVNYSFEIQALISEKEFTSIIPKTLAFIDYVLPSEVLGSNVELKEFLKYANLAVNLVNAESKEDLAEALETTALPVGSFRIKRNSFFSVSLNGYAGFSGGMEYLTNVDEIDPWNGIFRFSAPIGIGLNWGLTSKKFNYLNGVAPNKQKSFINSAGELYDTKNRAFTNHSLTAFISIVDLGAITAFRLSNTDTPIENVNWNDVFSPGLRFIWGIGNTPMAFGIGAQYLPSLREITVNDGVTNNVFKSNSLVFDATLTVDIPIFHFYTRTDKYNVKEDQPNVDKINFIEPSENYSAYVEQSLNSEVSPSKRVRLEIKLHDIKGYDDKQRAMADTALILLDKVINSDLFKTKLLDSKLEQTNNMTSQEIYDLILAGVEDSRIEGVPGVMDLYLRTITREEDGKKWARYCKRSTIGKEADRNGYISTCPARLTDWEGAPYILAGHLAHEYLHNIGLKHNGNAKKREKSAVYQIGYLIRDLAEKVYHEMQK